MSLQGKHALITGSSRGIGRGIALKLAAQGVMVAINYRQNKDAANDTLAQVRACRSDGCLIQADIAHPEDIRRMFAHIQTEFGKLDIFVNNALGELFTYYQPPMALTLEQWNLAFSSQAQAFLLGAQESAHLMPDGGRIVAITYAPGARTGSWQPYVAQGTAKAAMDSLVRYFAVALAPRGITVNSISPGGVFGAPNGVEGGIFRALPQEVQDAVHAWHTSGWTPMRRLATPGRHWERRDAPVHGRSQFYHGANAARGRWGIPDGLRVSTRPAARMRGILRLSWLCPLISEGWKNKSGRTKHCT